MKPNSPLPVLPQLLDIASGKTSAETVFSAYAERIAAREPTIKAFAHLDVEAARKALAGGAGKRLKGLPVGIKDIFDTADMPTSYGSAIYQGHRPASDAAIVMMTRQAGGTIIGKTTTTAFAHLDPTETENPAAPGHTPGGSSSGSAAAVSGGMVPFAIGTQTGGSVNRPAAYCGIAGFKPSYRILSTVGMKHYSSLLDTVGLFAPTVSDVAYFAEALTGRPLRVDEGKPATPVLGIVEVPDWSLAETEMSEAVMRVARAAERAGAKLVSFGKNAVLQKAWELHGNVQMYEAARSLVFEYERFGARLPPLVKAELDEAQKVTFQAYDEARGAAALARREMGVLFSRVDALIMPAAPGAPPKTLASTGRALFNRLNTLTGDPAVSVPGMVNSQGLPLGIQIVGPFGEDHKALAAARFVEAIIAGLS